MPYVFDLDTLERLDAARHTEFGVADPYPHIVFDGFLRPNLALELARTFPQPDDPVAWDRFGIQTVEVKLASAHEERFPAAHRQALHDLNSGPFVSFLEQLSGIEHLLPDPHLTGGGLHLSRQGDHLGIHADFNWHPRLEAHRRLNLLVYLTPQWKPGYGGELELWDTSGTRRVRVVEPLFNRAVLFATRSDTFHGHPTPWSAPNGIYRQSLALYYYTTNRPEHECQPAHSTLYKGHNA